MRIGIVNNSLGNLGSVLSAFHYHNFDAKLINAPTQLTSIDLIVLAGVGNFKTAVKKLKANHFWEKLQEENKKGKPIAGFCLGMQLFAERSFEDGETHGLGWLKGDVIKINDAKARTPHIGWSEVKPKDKVLFKNIRYNFFYFMHSYHMVLQDKSAVAATTPIGMGSIISAIRHKNLTGVQFHPEKSQGDGLRLIKNLVEEFS